jgi:phosphoribosylformimino-5-aminoimidazole carboxamide ribotide isomerase
MNLRPCIDLHEGKVKQIIGSSLSSETVIENYVSGKSIDYFIDLFKNDNLYGGHIIMLGPGNEEAALSGLKKYKDFMQIGGGINDKNAEYFIQNGASHVILTSYLFSGNDIDFNKISHLTGIIGKDRLVIDMSCKKINDKYYAAINRWATVTKFEVNETNLNIIKKYCDEFLIHAVDVEGKKSGIDKELVQILANINGIKITYAGGIRNLEDVDFIKSISNNIDITIGSALDIFGGQLSYKQVVNYLK